MEYNAICRLCGDKINLKNGNVYNLGEHLITKHPSNELTHFTFGENVQSKPKPKNKFPSKLSLIPSIRKSKSATSTLNNNNNNNNHHKTKDVKSGKKKRLYKTTVESWHPGCAPLTCPKCGATEQPFIRKQRNKVSRNSVGAFFLLGCWPLCFLPLVMCSNPNILVYCRKCKYCFGTYDKKKGKLIPLTKDAEIDIPNICV